MLTPGERGGRQCHPEQDHGGSADDGGTAHPLPPGPARGLRAGCRAPVAQWFLDETHCQIGQYTRDQQNRQTVEEVRVRSAGVGEPEDQQRPVPEVQRVRHRAQRHQWRGSQQPVRKRQTVTDRCAVGCGQDQQHRCSHRNQCPGSGELFDAVDQGTAGQDRQQRNTCQHRPQPHRPGDVGHQRAHHDTEQQFPGPGEAVVVGGELIGLMRHDRVDERGDRQDAQHGDEDRPQACAESGAQ